MKNQIILQGITIDELVNLISENVRSQLLDLTHKIHKFSTI